MNFEDIKRYIFEEAKKAGLDEYEIFYTSDSSISAETLKDEISAFSCGVSGGISFRCIVDGKMGAASSELMTKEALKSLVSKAASNAKNIESDDPAIIFEGSKNYGKTNMPKINVPDAATAKKNALEMQKKVYAESDLISDGTQTCVMGGTSEMFLANSKGLELDNKYSVCGSYIQAVVNKDGQSEEDFEVSPETEPQKAEEKIKEAVKTAVSKLGAKGIASGKYDIIFSSYTVRTLLSTFSPIFSAKNAQLGLSLLKGKEGEKIASDCITLVDDPMREGCMAQTFFDGEGVATYKKNVIEKGVLKTMLYDISTAEKAGVEPTGNGQRANYSNPVFISPYSFYIESGKRTLEEIAKGVKDGIYITEMNGLHAGADAVTGDLSIDSEGYRIRNGKICEAVKGFTVAGNFFEMMKNIEEISSGLKFGLPSGFTSYGSPDILIRKMSIAGE